MTSSALERAPVDPAIGSAIDIYNRLDLIRSVLAPDLSDQELQLFAIVAERSRLDPFAKQIYAIKRKGRMTFQTGIDGFRSSAEDTGEYRGSDEPEYGDTIAQPFPHPEWARVVVHRQFPNGEWLHQPKKVFWDELYPGGPEDFSWRKMPRNQLAKCAEAGAFRIAFPKRFSDVYTHEEMEQADAAEAARPVAPTVVERVAARRAEHEAKAAGSSDRAEPGTAPANQGGTCSIASPKGEPCLVQGAHSEHRNGVRRWSTPQTATTSGRHVDGQERGQATPLAKAAEDESAAGVGEAPAADTVHAQTGEIIEGEYHPVDEVPADIQAGLDLIPPEHRKGA